ncbi:hypothetical protein CsSME_00026817 [Camellia sinensis var. sinensis]
MKKLFKIYVYEEEEPPCSTMVRVGVYIKPRDGSSWKWRRGIFTGPRTLTRLLCSSFRLVW